MADYEQPDTTPDKPTKVTDFTRLPLPDSPRLRPDPGRTRWG